jgi:ribosomal protein S18 acetylase RimI-like enzyme
MRIIEVSNPAHLAAVRELFLEYANSLETDLCFQDFQKELASLPGKYAPPRGHLLIAYNDQPPSGAPHGEFRIENAAGCVGLRPLSDTTCEMKRLYIRPAWRGQYLGRELALAAIAAAREAGYTTMRLDTLGSMKAAHALYRSLGFTVIEPYYRNPVPGVIFMELTLSSMKTLSPSSSTRARRALSGMSLAALLCGLFATSALAAEPLHALMIAGGCCHDYTNQTRILAEGISARSHVVWTIVHEGDEDGKDHKFALYEKGDWAKGYDVVVHDECSGGVTNVAWIEQIARAHFEGTPAVVLHCAIHSYRNAPTDQWRKLVSASTFARFPGGPGPARASGHARHAYRMAGSRGRTLRNQEGLAGLHFVG